MDFGRIGLGLNNQHTTSNLSDVKKVTRYIVRIDINCIASYIVSCPPDWTLESHTKSFKSPQSEVPKGVSIL